MITLTDYVVEDWSLNENRNRHEGYPIALRSIINRTSTEMARQVITKWPGFVETPLVSLRGLANLVGVEQILIKDESVRFDLKSFKALGGAYAVERQLIARVREATGLDDVGSAHLLSGEYRSITEAVTVCCATDGNHGRSVAWGAKLFGCRSIVYIHADVSEYRERAMRDLGAEVVRIDGNYDESVALAYDEAVQNDWILVSDTTDGDFLEICTDVMHGYTVMALEIVESLAHDRLPTHVFVQGGVGGLAAAVCGCFWETWGRNCPKIVTVEPKSADCILQSIRSGQIKLSPGDLNTVMAGLSCGKVSVLAWDILSSGVDAALTISDKTIPLSMRLLNDGVESDPSLQIGESGVAGLSGLVAARRDPMVSAALELDKESRVLLFGTEGATDPALFQKFVSAASSI